MKSTNDKGEAIVSEIICYSSSPPKWKAFEIHLETVTAGLAYSDILFSKASVIPSVLDELNIYLVFSSGAPH